MTWDEKLHPRDHGKFAHSAGASAAAKLGDKKLATVQALVAKGNDPAATSHERDAYLARARSILGKHGLTLEDLPERSNGRSAAPKAKAEPTAEDIAAATAYHFGHRDPSETVTSRTRNGPATTRSGGTDALLKKVTSPAADLGKLPKAQLTKAAAELKRRLDADQYDAMTKPHIQSAINRLDRELRYRR